MTPEQDATIRFGGKPFRGPSCPALDVLRTRLVVAETSGLTKAAAALRREIAWKESRNATGPDNAPQA
ncbi:hypothetical protein [Primorskyibacter sp. S87]|uniref:hypothetical protein n=1 Tax=Primorskyibacter sp. S87 TaxID=3415126 RepID=UPI003C7BE0A9